MSLFNDFTTATSSRVRWTSLALSFLASMKILTCLNGLWNESSGAGRVVSREKKACGRIIYGVYLTDETFLRQEEILQLNTLFSWKLCTGNWMHEAEEIKNKWKEEDDQEAIRCSQSPAAVALSCWSQIWPVWNQCCCQVPACHVTGTRVPAGSKDLHRTHPNLSCAPALNCWGWAVPQNILCSIIP